MFPPDLTKRVLNRIRGRAVGPVTINVTRREITVLRLMAEGHRNKQIARNLGISPGTVGNHVANVYNKLGVVTALKPFATPSKWVFGI